MEIAKPIQISCVLAQLGNSATSRGEEAESTISDSALITCRISPGPFSRYRARMCLSLSYRTTSIVTHLVYGSLAVNVRPADVAFPVSF